MDKQFRRQIVVEAMTRNRIDPDRLNDCFRGYIGLEDIQLELIPKREARWRRYKVTFLGEEVSVDGAREMAAHSTSLK